MSLFPRWNKFFDQNFINYKFDKNLDYEKLKLLYKGFKKYNKFIDTYLSYGITFFFQDGLINVKRCEFSGDYIIIPLPDASIRNYLRNLIGEPDIYGTYHIINFDEFKKYMNIIFEDLLNFSDNYYDYTDTD